MYVSIYLSILLSSSFFSCASTASEPVLSESEIVTHDAASVRSAEDLVLALSEMPEYAEIFDLFVSLQVMMQEQKPLKTILRMAQQLRNHIVFVQKYASDPLLDEVLAWCQAQKGLENKKMAVWKKVVIAAAVLAVLFGGISWHARLQSKKKYVLEERPLAGIQQYELEERPLAEIQQYELEERPLAEIQQRINAIREIDLSSIPLADTSGVLQNTHGVDISRLPELVPGSPDKRLPFFSAWKMLSGQEFSTLARTVRLNVEISISQRPLFDLFVAFIKTAHPLQETITADNTKEIGMFTFRGHFYFSARVSDRYYLWVYNPPNFVPIRLEEAHEAGLRPDELPSTSDPTPQNFRVIALAKQNLRKRREILDGTAVVNFYISDPAVIQGLFTVS
jgi:hypothetical protein